MISGSSTNVMNRIGALHFGHSSGSASWTLRMSRAQAAFARSKDAFAWRELPLVQRTLTSHAALPSIMSRASAISKSDLIGPS